MNTWKACEETTRQICQRFGLELEDVIEIQTEQAKDFLQMWNYARPYQIALSQQELDLFFQLPEFQVFWLQLWTNQDRRILANTSLLEIRNMQENGVNMNLWYASNHNHKGGQYRIDQPTMDAFEAHQKQAKTILSTFKQLLK